MAQDVLQDLIEQLALERIEANLFRGQSQNLGWGAVFGGQVLGQALSAAAQTTPDDRFVHSMHAYFLRTGDPESPIVYDVDRIRDGRSFTTRRVVAIQAGRPIFNMSASFQIEEPGFEHQDTMPEVPPPEDVISEKDLATMVVAHLPEKLRKRATSERAIEIRPINPWNPLRPTPRAPTRAVWLKAAHKLPENPKLHAYLFSYASDFNLLGTSLMPHAVSWLTPGMQVASLDHAMWFHRRFRMDEWLLYVLDSESASGGRGLTRGRLFDRSGQLVASVAQEGLIRNRNLTPEPSQEET
ncbi:MAG: acyl-CoA thioesterase-2 [Myxococcota bacterium]|jgi:acyl-CoA thioesterase-2